MKKSKKTPQYQYGIEITKPFSKAMYDHNDAVAEVLKLNITKAWNEAFKLAELDFISYLEEDQQGMLFADSDWSIFNANQVMQDLSKGVIVTGYGGGFTIQDVQNDFYRDLKCMENWQLHETYAELYHDGCVPRMDVNVGDGATEGAMMVGFGNNDTTLIQDYANVYNLLPIPLVSHDFYSDQIEVPCSALLDGEMANESDNIQ